jgi:serine/threonine-protein kinase HipA
MAANCDDHSKNFSFILSEGGSWQLAPAYDVTHAYNPKGEWTNQHLMGVNGKFTGISKNDMLAVADRFGIGTAPKVLRQVGEAISAWPEHAEKAGIGTNEINRILQHHQIL